MVEREVKAHRLVDHPNIMPLVDHETVTKGENREARMLFPFFQVYIPSFLSTVLTVNEIQTGSVG